MTCLILRDMFYTTRTDLYDNEVISKFVKFLAISWLISSTRGRTVVDRVNDLDLDSTMPDHGMSETVELGR